MRIACLSDLHGHLPEVPDCDLLLLGGDYPPPTREVSHRFWYQSVFGPWLASLSLRMKVIGVAGNHDLLFERDRDLAEKLPWTYLQDSGTEFQGLKVWGSPWQPRFHDWSFNADEPELAEKWEQIPKDTDILLLHGPPHGFGDKSPYKFNHRDDTAWPGYEHTGSPSLTRKIVQIAPKLVVAGHIHNGYGRYQIGNTLFVNAALVDNGYWPAHEIIVAEI